MVIKLKYGSTNTYFINGLLIDTDYAGTLPLFFKELKNNGIAVADIKYVLATHYHPDHMGLISQLNELGVRILLIAHQAGYVHYPDKIFMREPRLQYKPIDESRARVVSCEESRNFLSELGIQGEIVPTVSHSADGIAIILDDGNCFAGDLEPFEFIGAYESNRPLENDWKTIMSYVPKVICYGHANEKIL